MELHKFLILALLLSCIRLQAQNDKPRIEKEPSWITINEIDYSNSRLDYEAEEGYLDFIYEKQVSLAQQSVYYRKAIKIISEAGVQNKSEISVTFDPSYEQLIFHSIKIMRREELVNQLGLKKFKIIRQETELDKHIYNETLSALLLLEDVRKGDIIEYSYTLKGFNTIFKNKYSDMYGTVFSVPVCNLYYKIIVPAGRTINIKNDRAGIEPLIKRLAGETSYEWKQKDIPALRVQDDLPEWYDPYPSIMLSEYNSWKEVNDWAMQLFPFTGNPGPAIQKKVEDIRRRFMTPEKKILAALRFVQDEVRYTGIEMGENSHKPHPPEKILAQRFGDCKDKSYLLCTLLRALGIEATPVLINTVYKKSLSNWLPSATAFDHVTVKVKLNDSSFFFDPTIPYQRGAITDISYPDYQCGLVIDNSTTALTNIQVQEKGMVKIKEVFNITHIPGDVQLKVITTYSGSFADEIRSSFNDNSRYEMLRRFQKYYAGYFEKIKGDRLDFESDDSTGIFMTEEYYTIPDIWKTEEGRKKAHFESFVINSAIRKPADLDRTMPFSLRFPARYSEDIEINLPEEWDASESSDKITCTNFLMRTYFSYSHKKILLQYEYESYKDNVSPTETRAFLESYDRIDKSSAYVLTYGGDKLSVTGRAENKSLARNKFSAVIIFITVIGFIVWWTKRN